MHLKTLVNKKQIYNVYKFFKQSTFLLSLLILIFIVRVTSGFLQENPYIYEIQLTFLTRHNLPSLDWPVMKAWDGGWERT